MLFVCSKTSRGGARTHARAHARAHAHAHACAQAHTYHAHLAHARGGGEAPPIPHLSPIDPHARCECRRKFLVLYDLNVEEFFLATWANWRRVKCVESKETEENIDKCKEVRMLDIDMCTKMNDAWANGCGSNVLKLKTIANGGSTAAQEPPSLKVEAVR